MEDDNLTSMFTCAESSYEDANDTILPPEIARTSQVIYVLFGLLQVFFGTFLNVLILILVYKFKKLRTVSFAIAVQIALADLALALFYSIPVVNNIAEKWVLGLQICIVYGFLVYAFSAVRTLLVFVFFFDRFANVFLPFHYHKYSCKTATVMCIVVWTLCTSLNFVSIPPLLDCYTFSEQAVLCIISSRCNTKCTYFVNGYLIIVVTPAIISPVVFILALYMKGVKIRRNESKMLGLDKKRMSEQDWKALNTFTLLFVGVCVMTIVPAIMFYVAEFLEDTASTILVQFATNIVTLLVITDPIIIMRNADVKDAIKKLMAPCFKALQQRMSNADVETNNSGPTALELTSRD